MKNEERCPRCGGNLLNKTDYDYVFDINYQMCLQCGKILYDENDGFGIIRYRLKHDKKRN